MEASPSLVIACSAAVQAAVPYFAVEGSEPGRYSEPSGGSVREEDPGFEGFEGDSGSDSSQKETAAGFVRGKQGVGLRQ